MPSMETGRVPELPASPAVEIVADLHIEVGDDRGRTKAHLSSDSAGLVLDVDEPVVLLRSVPGRGLARDLPLTVPPELISGVSMRVRSRGRDLGRVRLTPSGAIRFRPTVGGLIVAGRTAASYGKGRSVLFGAAAAAVALLVVGTRRRRR